MSDVKTVNRYFRNAIRADVDRIRQDIVLTDRQDTIFNMFYIQRKDRLFIADTLFISPRVVDRELRQIRDKILRIL